MLKAFEDIDTGVNCALYLLSQLAHLFVDVLVLNAHVLSNAIVDKAEEVRNSHTAHIVNVKELEDLFDDLA